MIPTSLIRPLLLQGPEPAHLSAASGLACAGRWLYVAADDELGLGCFPLHGDAPGELRRLAPPGVPPLPAGHDARKARKPDTEALAHLPPLPQAPHGALLALGSGSRPNRQQGALWALDASGALAGQLHAVDLAPLYTPLHQRFGALNIEGAFVEGGALVLLQRGHRGAPVNASIRFAWPAVGAWLAGQGGTPPPLAVAEHALGGLDGVPLGFTDGAALPGGGWLFSAAAEDSADAYLDGACVGSVVGEVDAAGALRGTARLDLRCKVEGLVCRPVGVGGAIGLLMVTDADDRSAPARLLGGCWPR